MAYYYASMAYEDVLERGIDSATIAKKIADSYSKIDNITKANEWFDFLSRKGLLSQSEMIEHANLKKSVGDYAGSEEIVRNYQLKYGEDKESSALMASLKNRSALLEDKGQFVLNNPTGNTPASEIGVAYLNDSKILVASSKKSSIAVNRIQAWTGGHYYNLYISEPDDQGNLSKLKPLKKEANTKYNDGPACYDSVNGLVYFTRNSYIKHTKTTGSDGTMRLKVYRGKLGKNGLTNIQELAFNSDEYSCGHPSISADGKTLYFASDKPGGFGGTDLYKVSINENGIVTEPINLGEIVNTPQDEFFPFIHPTNNLLFFSSGGHQGLGGQDVFVARIGSKGDLKKVENVGGPINTSMDEFAFINNADQTQGYISSNRPGGIGNDDIYSFKQAFPFKSSATLQGTSKDLISSLELENATIELIDSEGNVVNTINSDENGAFELDLESITDDFKLVASKDGYIVAEKKVVFDENADTYEQDLSLMPVIDYYLAGKVQDKITHALLEEVHVEISDLKTKKDLADQTTDANGKFNSENVNYAYGDTVKYEIILSKPGYITKTYVIRDLLSSSPEIYISGEIDVMLTPIEKGVDVGTEVGLNTIYFDVNSSILRSESKTELDKIIVFLKENPNVSMELGAHTDCRADEKYNVWLSKRRAKNSADYIKARISNPSRITFEGYGESKPIYSCNCDEGMDTCTDEQHQKNRRTEFIILRTDK